MSLLFDEFLDKKFKILFSHDLFMSNCFVECQNELSFETSNFGTKTVKVCLHSTQ